MSENGHVQWKETGVLEQIADVADKRIICLYGGSSSSKTISALQYLTAWCLEYPEPLIVTVVGESIPVLKKSVIRDWQMVVMRSTFDRRKYNKLELTYSFDNGSIIQFVPADDESRFLGPRQDFTLIDEAYVVSKAIFDQLEIRTRRQVLLTWNPVSPFWATKLEDERDDVAVIHATYKINPYVEQSIIDSLELRALTDPNFYDVYVLGKYGSVEGLIFKEKTHWFKCDELPPVDERKRTLYVIDYGFTHDPTSVSELVYSDGQFWVDEIEYKPGMFNSDIHDIIKLHSLRLETPPEEPMTHEDLKKVKTRTECVADSAEPKSNAELKLLGLNVIPSIKGPDSVKFGINTMKEFRINVTKGSLNIIKEFRNYSWKKDKHGECTETPVDNWNHAIDGIRYGITHVRRKPNFGHYAVS